MHTANPAWQVAWHEVQLLLDEEIQRLPEKYREPFILCCLENQSSAAAARRLGIKEGTVRSRLTEARKRLQARLSRRGVELTAVLGVAALTPSVASAQLPPALIAKAVAVVTSATLPASVHALVKGVTVSLAVKKAKLALVMLLAVSTLVGTANMWAFQKPPAGQEKIPGAQAVANQQKTVKAETAVAKDIYGDELPEGAVTRVGMRRFRHDGNASALAFTADGKSLVGYTDSGVIIWDALTGTERQRRLPVRPRSAHPGLDFSPDATTLAIANNAPEQGPSHVSLFDVQTGNTFRILALPQGETDAWFDQLSFTSDGKGLAASYGNKGKVDVFDLKSGQVRRCLEDAASRDGHFYVFSVSPDSKTVAAAIFPRPNVANPVNPQHELQLWDIATGLRIRTLHTLPPPGPKSWVRAVAFAPNGKVLAVGIMDCILLFDPATGRRLGQLEAEMGQVTRLAFAPDNNKLISAGTAGRICTWDVSASKILYTRPGWLGAVALSPDGNLVAGGTSETFVRMWNLSTVDYLWLLPSTPDGATPCGCTFHGSILAKIPSRTTSV
jgi:WD40 repeat protein